MILREGSSLVRFDVQSQMITESGFNMSDSGKIDGYVSTVYGEYFLIDNEILVINSGI